MNFFLSSRWSVRLALIIIALLALIALTSQWWLPYDPQAIDLPSRLLSPDAQHWLGTDAYGRDIASQLLVGARSTLAVGLVAASTFQAVIHILDFHLKEDFAIPHVALRLWDQPEGVGELPEFAAVSEELQVFAETLGRPYCGSTSGFETSTWFGDTSAHIRSQALVALRNGLIEG